MAQVEVCDVCSGDHRTESCPELGLDGTLVPKPLTSRARLTLPHFVQEYDFGNEEVGVFAQAFIGKKTQFGPYEAKKTTHEFNDDSLFILKITTKDGTSVSLDTTSENECNWLCLIRAATSQSDQNCMAYQLSTSIYYSTTRDVMQGEELKVWYAPAYAKRIGKPIYPDPICKVMLGMKVIYPSVEDLQDAQQQNKEDVQRDQTDVTKSDKAEDEDPKVQVQSNDEDMSKQEENAIVSSNKHSCKRCGKECGTEIELAKHIREHILPEANRKRGPKSKLAKVGRRPCGRPPKRRHSDQIESASKARRVDSDQEDEEEEGTIKMFVKEEVVESDDETVDKNFTPLLYTPSVKQEGARIQPRRSLKGKRITGYNADENFESIFKSSVRLVSPELDNREVKKFSESDKKIPVTETLSSPGVKRGRGRPRKVQLPNSNTAPPVAPAVTQKTPVDQPRTVVQLESEESVHQDSNEPTESNPQIDGESGAHDTEKVSQSEHSETVTLSSAESNETGPRLIENKVTDQTILPTSHNEDGISGECTIQSEEPIVNDSSEEIDKVPESLPTSTASDNHLSCKETSNTGEQPEILQTNDDDNKISSEQHSDSATVEPLDVTASIATMEVDPLQSILDELDKNSEPVETASVVMECTEGVTKLQENEVVASEKQPYVPDQSIEHPASNKECSEASEPNLPPTSDLNEMERESMLEGAGQEDGKHKDVESIAENEVNDGQGIKNETGMIDHKDIKQYMSIIEGENGKEYMCKICNKKFSLERYLRLHMPKHTNEYTCKQCGMHYTRKDSFRRHQCSVSNGEMNEEEQDNSDEPQKVKPRKTSDNSIDLYACDICSQCFANEKYLFRHMAMHTDIFKCSNCQKCFSRKDSLQRHVLKCCPEKASDYQVYACSKCSKTFSTTLGQENHESNCTKAVCVNCNKVFDSEEVLQNHQLNCAASSHVSSGKRFSCDECPKAFKSLSYLKQHKQMHEGSNACGLCNKILKSIDEKENHERFCFAQTVILKYGTVKCDECEDEFSNAKDYQNHYLTHTHPHCCEKCEKRFVKIGSLHNHVCPVESSDTIFMCNICRREFRSERALARHSDIHQDKKYACQYCNKRFHRRDYYNNHICRAEDGTEMQVDRNDVQLNSDKLVCHVCGKNFVSSSNLNKHMKVHGEKKCVCPICNKKFHYVEYLRIHIQGFHEKKFQFQCTHCGKVLTSKPGLISHTKLYHADQREVYSCPTCHKEFSQKGNMKTHMYSHTKERSFQCPYCPKSFKYPDQLNRHKLIHTMTNKLKCDHCDKVFVKPYELKKHCQLFHSGMMYVCDVCGARCGHRHTISRHYQRKHPAVAHMAKEVSFLDSLFKLVDSKEANNVADSIIHDEIQETNIVPIGEPISTDDFLPQVAAQALHSLSGANIHGSGSNVLAADGATAIMNPDGTLSVAGHSGQTFSIQSLQQSLEGSDSQQTVVILQIINPQDQEVTGDQDVQQVQVQQVEAQIVNANEEDQEEIANVESFVQDFVQVVEQEAEQIHILEDQIIAKEEISLSSNVTQ